MAAVWTWVITSPLWASTSYFFSPPPHVYMLNVCLSAVGKGDEGEIHTLSLMSPLDLLPTMSTSQPSKRSLSRRGLRYPFPVEDRYPQVIDAPRGRIRNGTFGASSRSAMDGCHSAASKSIFLEWVVDRVAEAAAPVTIDDRRDRNRFKTVKKSRCAMIRTVFASTFHSPSILRVALIFPQVSSHL